MNDIKFPRDITISYSTSPLVFHTLCLRIAETLSEDLAFANEICETDGDVSDRYDFTCRYTFTEPLTSDQVCIIKAVFRSYGLETGGAAFIRGGRSLEIGLVSVGVDHAPSTVRAA